MPLIKSSTEEAKRENIAEMIRAGHSPVEAVAAAHEAQRRERKAHGRDVAVDMGRMMCDIAEASDCNRRR